MRMNRMTQVKTNSPMKILFCGLISKVLLLRIKKSKSEIETIHLEVTQTYFNKFWHLSPLKFAEAPPSEIFHHSTQERD